MKLFIFNEIRPVVLLIGRLIRLEPKGFPGDHKEITPEQARHPHVVEFQRLNKVSVLTEAEAKERLKPAPAPKKAPPPEEPKEPEKSLEETPLEELEKMEVPSKEEIPPAKSDESFILDDEKKAEPPPEEPALPKEKKKEKSSKKRKSKKR